MSAIRLSKVLKPVLKLAADDFPGIAARQFGAGADMDRTWQHFAPVAHALVDSFWTTVDHPQLEQLSPRLDATDPAVRGVAYEGAGMGLALLDFLLPHKNRLREFLAGPGRTYKPLVYIGAGLVLPRIPVRPARFVDRYEDDDRWLVLDGYGFYHGFFDPASSLEQQVRPRRITGYAARVFDRGLGRSLWFTTGANVERITATINRFASARRPDLWSGVGLGCAYAAGVCDADALRQLLRACDSDAADFAVGVAMASEFRHEVSHPASHTELACSLVWDADSLTVARVAAAERDATRPDHALPRHEVVRQGIGAAWTERCRPTTPEARSHDDRIGQHPPPIVRHS